jgi:hypothetical protein
VPVKSSRIRTGILVAFVLLTSCKKSSTDGDACAVLVEDFKASRRAGTLACTEDADCACFNGIDSEVPCGGVIDVKTAAKLVAIETKMNGPLACKLDHQCPAQICNAGCTAGKCTAGKPAYH